MYRKIAQAIAYKFKRLILSDLLYYLKTDDLNAIAIGINHSTLEPIINVLQESVHTPNCVPYFDSEWTSDMWARIDTVAAKYISIKTNADDLFARSIRSVHDRLLENCYDDKECIDFVDQTINRVKQRLPDKYPVINAKQFYQLYGTPRNDAAGCLPHQSPDFPLFQ